MSGKIIGEVVKKEFAEYVILEYQNHYEINIKYKNEDIPLPSFHVIETKEGVNWTIQNSEKMCKIITILNSFTIEMEGYSYFGSNPGIPEDEYDDVATKLILELNL